VATLAVQKIVDAGTNVTYAAPTASDRADVGSGHDTFLHYKNTSGSPVTVTVTGTVGNTSYGVAWPNNVLTLAATTGELLIPLRQAHDQGDGLGALVTTSAQSGVTVALVRHS
jgi:hypothetical protein